MESLFIEPASLPGGQTWIEACAAATDEQTREALRCHITPLSGIVQVLLLLCVYGGILFKASELIANGSELLLLVPSLRSIVGSVVLPILGAVPDGAIVLFSGLGPDAQETLSVGVGALAGSTAMLLTVPWFLSVLAGRVSIRDGVPNYRPPKLDPPGDLSLTATGVQPMPIVARNGFIMLVTAVPYFVIQGAAFLTGNYSRVKTPEGTRLAAAFEKGPAYFCFIVCLLFFIGYLWFSVHPSAARVKFDETIVDELRLRYIRSGQVSLSAAFFEDVKAAVHDADETTGLQVDQNKKKRLAHLLYIFFHQYDYDNDRNIDTVELQNVMRDMGEKVTAEEITHMYNQMDSNGDGKIELHEFIDAMPAFILSRGEKSPAKPNRTPTYDLESRPNQQIQTVDVEEEKGKEEEEEEEEDMPDDLQHLDPDTQLQRVKIRSFIMMTIGTALVLIFSDPMVSVMSDFGRRIGVPAFYISFILAPLASNASELLAAYSYALKKTRKTVTISFATLLGAAIMNNTFVLSIFMLLIALKGLAWQFTAETIAIIVVELLMYRMSQKKIMTLRDGLYVLALFPVTIFIVMFLENVIGLD